MAKKTFQLHSRFEPAGDQPAAIDSLVEGLADGEAGMTLLGVTGSGKTFSIAKVIESCLAKRAGSAPVGCRQDLRR